MPRGILRPQFCRIALVAVLAGWLGIGLVCAEDDATSPAATAEAGRHLDRCEIYPLNVGREWSFRSGPLELIERVASHEMIEGELCARVETEFNGKIVNYEHLAVREDGIYRVAVAGNPVVPPLRFLKLPATAGDAWTVDSKIVGQSVKGNFKSNNAQVRIGEQEVESIMVQGTDFKVGKTELGFTYYFVTGVGKVKQVVNVGGQKTTLELPTLVPSQDRNLPRTARRP